MESRRASGVALAMLSAASFGCLPVLGKEVFASGADTTGLLAPRFTLAASVLLVLALVRGERLPRGRQLVGLAGLGGIGYSTQAICYFGAIERIPAGLAALLLYLYPAIVVVASAVIARRRPGTRATACVVVATIGTGLTIGPVAGGSTVGVLLGLGAAASYACYVLVGSTAAAGTGPLASAAVVMGAAAVVYDGLALTRGADLPRGTSAWAALVGVALLGTVVAVAAFFAALERLGAADTAVISTVEPLVAVGLAAVVLGETLTTVQAVGGVLVVAAVVVLARAGAPPVRESVVSEG